MAYVVNFLVLEKRPLKDGKWLTVLKALDNVADAGSETYMTDKFAIVTAAEWLVPGVKATATFDGMVGIQGAPEGDLPPV